MLSSGADGNGLSPSDQHYCRSEYHAGRKGLALSKSDDGTRAQEDTIGKVRCTVSVWYFLFSAAFYSVCDWGGNESDRNDPLEVADAICAGISYE